jgi:hypothetical protein
MLRRVLDPANDLYFPNRDLLSVIKTFIETIDEWMPRMNVAPQTRTFIEPRLRLCRENLARADRSLSEWGYPPVCSDPFRHRVTVLYNNAREFYGARYDDGTVRDPVFRTVFDDPFARNDFFLPSGASSEACTFIIHIQTWFWN